MLISLGFAVLALEGERCNWSKYCACVSGIEIATSSYICWLKRKLVYFDSAMCSAAKTISPRISFPPSYLQINSVQREAKDGHFLLLLSSMSQSVSYFVLYIQAKTLHHVQIYEIILDEGVQIRRQQCQEFYQFNFGEKPNSIELCGLCISCMKFPAWRFKCDVSLTVFCDIDIAEAEFKVRPRPRIAKTCAAYTPCTLSLASNNRLSQTCNFFFLT